MGEKTPRFNKKAEAERDLGEILLGFGRRGH
jgi:hypothetical protein